MRMSRPESSIRILAMFVLGALVVLVIMFFIAKAIMGSA